MIFNLKITKGPVSTLLSQNRDKPENSSKFMMLMPPQVIPGK